ncbi:MAG TPA: helix-turn-helix domain-containing protein [Bryobacteraceae bacterium]|nr:helix-turn-helix domain-containing protein [Bryobacteraceae bacterium]
MAGFASKLGRKKEGAIVALLSQRNVEEAARVAGIGPRTLYRWLKEPEFDAAYRAAKRAAFGQAVARLQQGASAAATTLLKTMIEPTTPASVRVRAAECVMNHAMKAIELEDIEARVAELERAAEDSQDGRR